MSRFDKFTDDELYMLKRQAIESSFDIILAGDYNEGQKEIHALLMNEIILSIKKRDEG